jgi:MoxR-like ATPase
MATTTTTTALTQFAERVIRNVETVIVGKRPQIEYVLVALLCPGPVLIDDVPGTGKTMLARAVAASMGLAFKRLQCTPDLLPNDVTGVSIYNQQANAFEFQPGPVFVNFLLVDEINRATPRTQSALLEAMQEQQVTVDGVTRRLPAPFVVLATQNPIEFEGTFPLPEAQLDRFLIHMTMGYPGAEDELQIQRNLRKQHPIEQIGQVVDGGELPALADLVTDVHVDETLEQYILGIVRATRNHPDVAVGASPRGALALYKTAQAFAALHGRDYVVPEDVREMAPLTLPHRISIKPESQLRGRDSRSIVADIVQHTTLDLGDKQ